MHYGANIAEVSTKMQDNLVRYIAVFNIALYSSHTYRSVIRKLSGQNDLEETTRAPSRKSANRSFS